MVTFYHFGVFTYLADFICRVLTFNGYEEALKVSRANCQNC